MLSPDLSFNPYRVFSIVATHSSARLPPMSASFNPYRGFSIVATYAATAGSSPPFAGFNPYRVFSIVATVSTYSYRRAADIVSIPIGFSLSLRRRLRPLPRICRLQVSIPIGFSLSLRPPSAWKSPPSSGVSIPIGFSLSLRRGGPPEDRAVRSAVSIPIGFSLSLRHVLAVHVSIHVYVFQSLSGFLYRCDCNSHICGIADNSEFQSLSGFLYRCDVAATTFSGGCSRRFNPYRVFSIVATLRHSLDMLPILYVSIPIGFSLSLRRSPSRLNTTRSFTFQSLSGFLYRCDGAAARTLRRRSLVSIPIGFSLSLRRWRRWGTRRALPPVSIPIGFSLSLRHQFFVLHVAVTPMFQSLSGFLYRCDSGSPSSETA